MPADGVWAVGNDLYGASVYVSSTQELITAILAADDIEAYRATASMQIFAEEWASWLPAIAGSRSSPERGTSY